MYAKQRECTKELVFSASSCFHKWEILELSLIARVTETLNNVPKYIAALIPLGLRL